MRVLFPALGLPSALGFFGVICLAFLLAACTTVPLTSIPKLRSIEPETTRIPEFMFAVSLPANLRPIRNRIGFELSISPVGQPAVKRHIRFVSVRDPMRYKELGRYLKPGFAVFVYEISDADRRWLESTRARVLSMRKEKEKGKGEVSAFVKADKLCLMAPFKNARAKRNATMDSFIRTSETGKFIPLTRGVKIKNLQDPKAGFPRCGGQ